jgi:hypothetical protein
LLRMIDADTRLRAALVAAASTRHTDRSVDRGSRSSGVADESNTTYAVSNRQTVLAAIDRCLGSHLARADSARAPSLRITPRRQSLPMAPAIAAALLAGVGVGVIGARTDRARNPAFVVANPTRILFETMRGENALPRVEAAADDARYVLIEIAVPRNANRIVLNMSDHSPTALVRSTDGIVAFLADRKTLAATPDANVSYVASGRTQTRPVSIPSTRSSLRNSNERVAGESPRYAAHR